MDSITQKTYEKIIKNLPDYVYFGFVPVKTQMTKTITVENFFTNTPIYLEVINDKNKGITIEPIFCTIPRGMKADLKISIKNEQAIVVVANIMIAIDKSYNKIIKISTIGKYSYLRIQKSLFDFGNVLIGKKRSLDLIITNPEKVHARFKIISKSENVFGNYSKYFTLSETEGLVPPNSAFLVKITYHALFADLFSCENFELIVQGGNKERLSCLGNSLAIKGGVNSKTIDFSSIELDGSSSKSIRLLNDAELDTQYQFFYNNPGPFYILEVEGVIPAKSNVRINIVFRPKETIIYYDRVYCMIKNHLLIVIVIINNRPLICLALAMTF